MANTEKITTTELAMAQDFWQQQLTPMERYEIGQQVGGAGAYIGKHGNAYLHAALTHLFNTRRMEVIIHAIELEQELQAILNS